MVTNVDRQLHRYLKNISASSKICKSNRSKHYWITDDSGSVVLHIRLSDHISGQMFNEKKSDKIDIIKVEKSGIYIVIGFGIQVNLWENEVVKFVKHLIGSRVMVSKQFSRLLSAAGKHASEVRDLNIKLKESQENLEKSMKKNEVLKKNITDLNNSHLETVKKVKNLKSENEELNKKLKGLTKELFEAKFLLEKVYSKVNPIMEEIKTINN